MGHTRMVKWMASNLDTKVVVYGDSKEELFFAMGCTSGQFFQGNRVMIMRQSPKVRGFSKVIVYGKPWTMPRREDYKFEELLENSRKEYFQTHKK